MKISIAQSLCEQHHRENKVFQLIIMVIVLFSVNKAFRGYKVKQAITTLIKGKAKLLMEPSVTSKLGTVHISNVTY